jgi:hypothetical protein
MHVHCLSEDDSRSEELGRTILIAVRIDFFKPKEDKFGHERYGESN